MWLRATGVGFFVFRTLSPRFFFPWELCLVFTFPDLYFVGGFFFSSRDGVVVMVHACRLSYPLSTTWRFFFSLSLFTEYRFFHTNISIDDV